MAVKFETFVSAGLFEELIPYLSSNDICCCEALALCSHRSIVTSNAWHDVVCREVQAFKLHPETRADKRSIKSFLPMLRKVSSMEPFPIPVSSYKEASEVALALGKFQEKACSHLSRGGSLAKVLVARFVLDKEKSVSNQAETQLKRSMPDIIFSKPSTTSLVLDQSSRTQVSLAVTMALEKNTMLLSAKLEASPESVKLPFEDGIVVDIRALSSALLLQMRDIDVKPDGSQFKTGSGLCLQRGRDVSLDASLLTGLTCILLVRDARAAHRNVSSSLAATLHLDRIRSA